MNRTTGVGWLRGMSIRTIELLVIFAVSLAAGFALFGPSVRSLIPFAALALVGVLTVVVLPLGTILFAAGAVIMTLPVLMQANGTKWWVFSHDRLDFCPTLDLPAAIAIGLLVISGSLLLGYLYPLHKEVRELQAGRADDQEIRAFARRSMLGVAMAVLVSALFAGAAAAIIAVVRDNLAGLISGWPWAVPAGGLALLVILAAAIFWLAGLRRKGA